MPVGPYIPRKAGLSRSVKVEPLHSVFKAKSTEIGRQRKITEPDDPDAPPLSDSSSEDDEATSRRGDIKRTTFQTNSNTHGGRKPTHGSRKSARTASKPTAPQSPKRPRDSEDEIAEPVRKRKVAGREEDGLGSQFKKDALQRRPVGAKKSYGTQKKESYGRAARASSKPLSIPEDCSSPEKDKPNFKPVNGLDDFSSPEKPKGVLVLPDPKDFAVTPSPKKSYQTHTKSFDDLDTPSPVKPFKPPRSGDDSSEESSPKKSSARSDKPKNDTDELMRRARLLRQKTRAEKEAKRKQQREMEDCSPEVVFKLPAGMGSQDDLAYDSDLDKLDGPQEVSRPVHDIFAADDAPVCPMCLEPVEQELLDHFSKKRTMTIAQQHRFCNHHKAKEARRTWIEKGYPDIDWSKLGERIAKHHRFLEDILNGGKSHFGGLLAKNVKAGKNRTLLKTDQNATPGYYGSRGARVMNENIIHRFSDLLRKVAVQDRLVSARGHMVFVQFVLVPELAVRLIMEDMDVPPEKARTIMEESQKVGNLLNEEADDVIVEDEVDQSDRKSTSSLSSLEDDVMSDGMS